VQFILKEITIEKSHATSKDDIVCLRYYNYIYTENRRTSLQSMTRKYFKFMLKKSFFFLVV